MFYKAELSFLEKALKKLHLQATVVRPEELPDYRIDMGLRSFLGREKEYEYAFRETIMRAKPKTIYKLTDSFLCNYIFMLLPDTDGTTAFVIGPYMSFEMSPTQMLEEAERFSVSAGDYPQLERFYFNVTVMKNEHYFFALLYAFAETVWRGEEYEIIEIKQELESNVSPTELGKEQGREDILLNMQIMETRYAYENELMQNVSKGLIQRAEMMLTSFTKVNFEQRMSDPLRNAKNYCIICNTLMRKAAERGGVHPVHIDKISTEFAYKIENLGNINGVAELMKSMVRGYCRAVREKSLKDYSVPIRRAVTYINENLSGELGLSILAKKQNMSPAYLSDLFKKETGSTITEFITLKRIELAQQMLTNTNLQIQTVAQHCGVSDVNYFSKMFKKETGITPRQFREGYVLFLGR